MFSETDGHSMVKNVQTEASKMAQQSKALAGLLEILGLIARTHMVIQYSGLPEHQTCTWWHRYL